MPNNDTFIQVFEQLKAILKYHEATLVVTADTSTNYSLDTTKTGPNKKPLFFGAVTINKNYVSYHLFPVYLYPALLDTISPTLKKRMQGKSCFNFKTIESETLRELADLTTRGLDQIKHY